jgi:hypothetical protein
MYREEKLLEIVRLFDLYGVKESDYEKLIRNKTCLKELELIVTPKQIRKEKKLTNKNDCECLLGKRLHKLVAKIRIVDGSKTKYLCQCDCGNTKVIRSCHLKSGLIRSCGCIKREQILEMNMKKKEEFERKSKEIEDEYISISKIPKIYPNFTVASIKWLLHKSKENGFYKYISRIGRNVYVNKKGFEKYIEENKEKLCR